LKRREKIDEYVELTKRLEGIKNPSKFWKNAICAMCRHFVGPLNEIIQVGEKMHEAAVVKTYCQLSCDPKKMNSKICNWFEPLKIDHETFQPLKPAKKTKAKQFKIKLKG